jgi:hypothetical protein
MNESNLIFVDCEGHGPAPTLNDETLFEFGAVDYKSKQAFHGQGATKETFEKFNDWLNQLPGRLIFVSDNPAYDWQFINYAGILIHNGEFLDAVILLVHKLTVVYLK